MLRTFRAHPPAGADTRSCNPELVPLNLPQGWGGLDADGSSLPQTATPGALLIVAGALFVGLALVLRRI